MDASISLVTFCSSSLFIPKKGFYCPIVALPPRGHKEQSRRNGQLLKTKCAKWGSPSKRFENEINMEKELVGMRKLNDKWKASAGIMELLESLEFEAIMGEDEGRARNDYNRRAQIFDECSRVFHALKDTTSTD